MSGTLELIKSGLSTDLNDTTNYKTHSYTITTPAPGVAYHVPDNDESQVVKIEDGDRLAQLQMTVFDGVDDDRDNLDNNITILRRLVRDAGKHAIDDSSPVVQFKTQPNGATNATYHDIKVGWLDDSGNHFNVTDKNNTIAYDTVLFLILTPYGKGDPITLENYLASSPHFLEDSDSNGLADGWNKREPGITVTSLNTTVALIGHQSQQVECSTASSNQGIYSDTVTVTASYNVSGYAWIDMADAGDQITVYIKDGTNAVIDSATISPGDTSNADLSIVSKTNGDTWYRVPVSGTGSNNDCYLEITRASADASAGHTFRVDGCYLNVTTGAITTSYGWISSRRTENDGAVDAEAEINYIDVWGIPGDAGAIALWKPTAQVLGLGFYMGRMTDGNYLASQQPHWLDSADGSGTNGSGTWSTNVDAALSGGSSARFTEGAGETGGYYEWTYTGDALRQLAATPRQVIGLVLVDAVDATFELGVYADGTNFASHNITVNPAVASIYTLLDLGTINLKGLFPDDVPDTANPSVTIRVTLSGMTNTEVTDIDALFLPPIVDDYMVYHITQGSGFAADELWINGNNKSVVPEARGFDRYDWSGSMWNLAPGQTMNRVVFMTFANSTQFTFDLAAGFNWKLDVTPRARHLTGTI